MGYARRRVDSTIRDVEDRKLAVTLLTQSGWSLLQIAEQLRISARQVTRYRNGQVQGEDRLSRTSPLKGHHAQVEPEVLRGAQAGLTRRQIAQRTGLSIEQIRRRFALLRQQGQLGCCQRRGCPNHPQRTGRACDWATAPADQRQKQQSAA